MRREIHRKGALVSPEAIDAYRRKDRRGLARALGLRPWEVNPLDIAPGEVCPWPSSSRGAQSWPRAVELRNLLEQATND